MPLVEDAGEFDEDEFIDLDGDEFEEDEAEDVVAALGLGEDDAAPGISTGGTVWGEAGFKAAEKVEYHADISIIDCIIAHADGCMAPSSAADMVGTCTHA